MGTYKVTFKSQFIVEADNEEEAVEKAEEARQKPHEEDFEVKEVKQ